MKRSLAIISLVLFGISVIFLIVWTLSESAFAGMSTAAERIITVALFVLPAGIGAVMGVMSLMYREGKTALAITGIVLNTLFALFHLMIVLFAG
ncbi:MAG TPA: hypothetical protein VIR02_17785 [Anaerolineales bacterium]